METLLAAICLLIVGVFVYYGPEWFGSKSALVTVQGIDYLLQKNGDLSVLVKFNRDGVDFTYRKDFEEMALRDLWMQQFGSQNIINIMHELTGDLHAPPVEIPPLIRGKALVLCGPAGSGKGVMAKKIMEDHGGTYNYPTVEWMSTGFTSEPADIWCVEDLERLPVKEFEKLMEYLKGIISSETMVCERKGKPKKIVKTPHIILTVQPDIVSLFEDTRRFQVVKL